MVDTVLEDESRELDADDVEVAPPPAEPSSSAAGGASRRWRGIWRMHFYSGAFAAPSITLTSSISPRSCKSSTSAVIP